MGIVHGRVNRRAHLASAMVLFVWLTGSAWRAAMSVPVAPHASAASASTPRWPPTAYSQVLDRPRPYGPPALVWKGPNGWYRAVHVVSRWNPKARTWTVLSKDLTEDATPGAPGFQVDGITAVAQKQGAWYVGTFAGRVQVKLPGQPWRVADPGLPERTVTAVAISPDDPAGTLAVVGFGGYGSSTPFRPGHVYGTRNGGTTWIDLTGDLPDKPVAAIRFVTVQGRTTLEVKTTAQWYGLAAQGHWAVVTASVQSSMFS